MKPESTPGRFAHKVALLMLALVIICARLRTYGEPPERDITTYAVIAHELLEGRTLYDDLWDHKPPAIHIAYAAAELVAGYGLRSVFLLSVTASLLTLIAVYSAVERATRSPSIALWSSAVWAVTANDLQLQGNSPNTEVFINAALAWAMVLLINPDWPNRRRTIGIAILFAIASLFKHVAIAFPIMAAIGMLAVSVVDKGVQRRSVLADLAIWASVGLLFWSAVEAYFVLTGRSAAYHAAVFTYNQSYAGSLGSNILNGLGLSALFPPSLRFASPLVGLSVIGIGLGLSKAPRRSITTLAFILASAIAVALHGFPYAHYYQMCLPPLIIGGGIGLYVTLSAFSERLRWLPRAAGALVLISLAAYELPTYGLEAQEWSRSRYGEEFVAAADLGKHLDRWLTPTQTFYNWGTDSGIYFSARQSPPSGVFYVLPLLDGPLADALNAKVVGDLGRRNVDLIIVNQYFPLTPTFERFLSGQYSLAAEGIALDPDKPILFYARNGVHINPRIVGWRPPSANAK